MIISPQLVYPISLRYKVLARKSRSLLLAQILFGLGLAAFAGLIVLMLAARL